MYSLFVLLLQLFIHSCTESDHQTLTDETIPDRLEEIREQMVDKNATSETVGLYRFLLQLTRAGSGMLYGHEATNMQGWSFNKFNPDSLQSDVLASIGDLPAVFGYDFNRGYKTLFPIVKQAVEAGGIITISNHMKFPTTKAFYYPLVSKKFKNPVQEVLPGGAYHQDFLKELDRIADFAQRIRVNGKQVPILFRPWHEHTGKWFWWGKEACTEKQFNELWRFTVRYLRDIKQIHNFIYVFSPSRPGDHGGYSYRNPGEKWFDIAGFDCRHTSESEGVREFMRNALETARYAKEHGKIAAIAEFGYRKGINRCSNPQWYSKNFLAPLSDADLLSVFVYCLNWQDGKEGRAVPKQTDLQYEDFVRFHDDERIHFLYELKKDSILRIEVSGD